MNFERQSSYERAELLACGHGQMFGEGNAHLPLPPMLMFDRITHISDKGGAYGKGEVIAELDIVGRGGRDTVARWVQGKYALPGR